VALRQDGTVWAWGNNWFGQLGNGSTAYTASPGPVVGLTGVTSIACFANQSIALLKDGTVRAWGANESGQVGDGTTTDRWQPTPVAGLTQITAISGTTALRQDGSVWEWGYVGWSGQKPHLVAVRSIGIADAIALGVSSGGVFGARVEAIRSDLQGWWEWTPGTTPTLQPDLGRISAVASAPYHTLVLRSDGTVLASGLNNSGQLGNGINPSGGWDWQADFLPVVGAVSMRQIAAGLSHSLALDASGNVWAWGDDEHGQLGRGVTLSRTVPTEVPGLRNIVQVSAGREGSSFAVDADGHLWVWGLNAHGRLGDGSGASRSRPFELPGFDNVRSVARGMTWSSVALKHDGTVWTWGNNFSGQLGSGTTEAYTTRPAIVPGLASVTDVAASGAHMLALKSDESVWSWGSNDNGQLGLGNTAASPAPVLVPTLSGVRSVVAGDGRSFALMADGTVMGWGSGRWGALGDGTWWYWLPEPWKYHQHQNSTGTSNAFLHFVNWRHQRQQRQCRHCHQVQPCRHGQEWRGLYYRQRAHRFRNGPECKRNQRKKRPAPQQGRRHHTACIHVAATHPQRLADRHQRPAHSLRQRVAR
jgi:alpha-tubulin suppressor-like RCC1 family protein